MLARLCDWTRRWFDVLRGRYELPDDEMVAGRRIFGKCRYQLLLIVFCVSVFLRVADHVTYFSCFNLFLYFREGYRSAGHSFSASVIQPVIHSVSESISPSFNQS
jgi:hypothetical protein